MKSHFHQKLRRISEFCASDIGFTLVPAILWSVATHLRAYLIKLRCLDKPSPCTVESVFHLDQLSMGFEDWRADLYSYWGQNMAGVLAVLAVVFLYGMRQFLVRRNLLLRPPENSSAFFADFFILAQTILWNGFLTELSHLIVQRPRPFVYMEPLVRGADPAHYTSFYSGHTSFTAAVGMAVLLLFLRRGVSHWIISLWLAVMFGLVASTAYFRILAGRHFLTDVIFGALAGFGVAWLISIRCAPKSAL